MSKAKKSKGFTPSPFFTSWWGSLAERVWRVAPLKRKLSSRPEIPHDKQEGKTPHQKCPCEAFTMCDTAYQNLDPIVKDSWRFCVKKRGMSGYGLYMKECLCLLINGYNYPLVCSPSGGYNCLTVIPGEEEPEKEEFIGQALPRYSCTGPPDWNCVPSPSGAYKNLEACAAICNPPGPYEPGDPCPLCADDTPSMYTTAVSGIGGDGEPWNGIYDLPQSNPCSWQREYLPAVLKVQKYFATNYLFQLIITVPPSTLSCVTNTGDPDCYEPQLLPFGTGTGIFEGQTNAECQLTTSPV